MDHSLLRKAWALRIGVLVFALPFALSGCGPTQAQGGPGGPPTVSVAPATQRSIQTSEDFSARIEAQQTVELRSRVAGTVDKVQGDRILLTKSDADAGGHHHSIPSRWLRSADDGRVTLTKTADQAQQHWRDEERSGADAGGGAFGMKEETREDGPVNLNRSFPGTY